MRTLPPGIDQRSASRHPDWVGPDDLRIKIEELREATDWAIPIYVKLGATRVDHDVKLAVAAGADVVVVDGMQGGTAATQDVFIEHAGIPTLPAVRMAAEALRDIGVDGEVQLVVSGGIRSGADVAKASRSVPTPSPSAWPRSSPSAATGPPTATTPARPGVTSTSHPTTSPSGPRRDTAPIATPGCARSASPRRTPCSRPA